MPHGPAEVGVGPWAGAWPRARQRGVRRRAARRGRPAQRRRPLPLLDASRRSVADLDTRRHDFHVAIENWQHDFNIGTIVRTANAFLAAEVHIVGERRWNRRGAMVTDRYQHVRHHPTRRRPRGVPRRARRPGAAVGHRQPARLAAPGDDGGAAADVLPLRPGGPGPVGRRPRGVRGTFSIAQFGSTRSINASAAAAIAMHAWIRAHADLGDERVAGLSRRASGRVADECGDRVGPQMSWWACAAYRLLATWAGHRFRGPRGALRRGLAPARRHVLDRYLCVCSHGVRSGSGR